MKKFSVKKGTLPLRKIRGDISGAWSLMCSKLGSGGACNIALSVAAGMSRGNSPGVYMDSTGLTRFF